MRMYPQGFNYDRFFCEHSNATCLVLFVMISIATLRCVTTSLSTDAATRPLCVSDLHWPPSLWESDVYNVIKRLDLFTGEWKFPGSAQTFSQESGNFRPFHRRVEISTLSSHLFTGEWKFPGSAQVNFFGGRMEIFK